METCPYISYKWEIKEKLIYFWADDSTVSGVWGQTKYLQVRQSTVNAIRSPVIKNQTISPHYPLPKIMRPAWIKYLN